MSKLFIETIRIQNRRVCNIKYHQKRFDDTRSAFFPFAKKINIRNAIDTSLCKTNMTKCRITYNDNIVSVEYQEYSMRPIASLHCVNIDQYDYSYKYLDRSTLTNLFHQKPENIDDIEAKVRTILQDKEALVASGCRGYEYAKKYFDRSILAQQYVNYIKTVV